MTSERHDLGLLFLLLGALTLALGLGACNQADPPRFPHLTHLTEIECGEDGQPECLTCSTCHTPSQQGRVKKLPELSKCTGCHEDDPNEMSRVLSAPTTRVSGTITFDHPTHLEMPEIEGQCVPCHAGVVDPARPSIPPMAQCFTCHEHKEEWDEAVCTPCHQEQDLRKTLPVTFLRHDESFLRHHANVAQQNEQLCQSCHTQSDCQSCHDLTQALTMEQRAPEKFATAQIHPADFLVRHSIEARSEPARCLSCHEAPSCDSCHVERGVSGNAVGGRNPHPPEWMGNNYGSRDFHGEHARRDVLSCAGCHEAGPATNCIRCHQVGAYGGNPHPNGWRSARGTGEEMCSYCHRGGM